MQIIHRVIQYYRYTDTLIHNNQKEIDESNQKLTLVMATMGFVCYFFFLIVSLVSQHYRPLFYSYLAEFLLLGFLLVLLPKLKQRIPSAYLIYSGYASLIGFAIYTSAFITPDYTSVVILLFLFQLPIMTLDKSWRVDIVVSCYALVYLVVAMPYKDPRLVPDEIFNCLLTVALGMVLGGFLRKARLENFELKRQALLREKTDFLTGLYNRSSLYDYVEELDADSSGQGGIGIAMVDIDYFKKYNDTYGHQFGDLCLKRVSECLLGVSKERDIKFFRYGGEEFVGIARGYETEELHEICEQLRSAVFALQIPHLASECKYVSISIGISPTIHADFSKLYKHLLYKADQTLYEAKAGGRNQVRVYTEDLENDMVTC